MVHCNRVFSDYIHKHKSPVWQITWNEQDRSSKTDNMEVLVSISSDGRVMQWTLRKEFEAMGKFDVLAHPRDFEII